MVIVIITFYQWRHVVYGKSNGCVIISVFKKKKSNCNGVSLGRFDVWNDKTKSSSQDVGSEISVGLDRLDAFGLSV